MYVCTPVCFVFYGFSQLFSVFVLGAWGEGKTCRRLLEHGIYFYEYYVMHTYVRRGFVSCVFRLCYNYARTSSACMSYLSYHIISYRQNLCLVFYTA